MKLSLVFPTYARGFPIAALYLTANLEKAGHLPETTLFHIDSFKENKAKPGNFRRLNEILENTENVVALGCMNRLLPYFLFALGRLKERFPEKIIILGGPGPAECPEEWMPKFSAIDYVVKDRDPGILAALVSEIESAGDPGNVPGVVSARTNWVRYTPAPDKGFSNFLMPKVNPFDLNQYRGFPTVTVEGCPYQCTFCDAKFFLKEKLLYRPWEDPSVAKNQAFTSWLESIPASATSGF